MNQFCNSVGYIAPESLNYGVWNTATDVYSLGIIFYTVVFGKNPFHSESNEKTKTNNENVEVDFNCEN